MLRPIHKHKQGVKACAIVHTQLEMLARLVIVICFINRLTLLSVVLVVLVFGLVDIVHFEKLRGVGLKSTSDHGLHEANGTLSLGEAPQRQILFLQLKDVGKVLDESMHVSFEILSNEVDLSRVVIRTFHPQLLAELIHHVAQQFVFP